MICHPILLVLNNKMEWNMPVLRHRKRLTYSIQCCDHQDWLDWSLGSGFNFDHLAHKHTNATVSFTLRSNSARYLVYNAVPWFYFRRILRQSIRLVNSGLPHVTAVATYVVGIGYVNAPPQ